MLLYKLVGGKKQESERNVRGWVIVGPLWSDLEEAKLLLAHNPRNLGAVRSEFEK